MILLIIAIMSHKIKTKSRGETILQGGEASIHQAGNIPDRFRVVLQKPNLEGKQRQKIL